ncbi:unnamed protein product [Lota lota]
MDPHEYGTPGGPGRLEIAGVEDADGNPVSALTILSLLERVAGIIDGVQACQQRMEEQQQQLEGSIRGIQGDVLKLSREHAAASGTVDKLLQKTRKVSANVKEVRARVEKQHARVKKVEGAQDELLTRNKFRVVIYQGETEVPSVAVTKTPKGPGLEGLDIEPDAYEVPADLSSDEEYTASEEAESTRGGRLKKSVMKGTESLKAAFSKEKMAKTKENLGTKFHHLGEKVVPPERREKMHSAGERLKQSGERLKENIAKKAPTKETFRIKLKKERTVAEGEEGAEGADEPAAVAAAAAAAAADAHVADAHVADAQVAVETKRERAVDEVGAVRIREDDGKEEEYNRM